MPHLYEIMETAARLRELADMTDDDAITSVIDEALHENEADLAEKLDACAVVLRELSIDADAYKSEIDRLKSRRDSIERNSARLRDRMQQAMEAVGMQQAKGRYTVALRQTPPSVSVYDETAIDQRWFVQQPSKLDKRGMLEHYKATGEIPAGVEIARGTTIGIR